jgi:hypothetical protein
VEGGHKKYTDQKTNRMGDALTFVTHYTEEGDEFLDSIVTGEERTNNSRWNGATLILPQKINSKHQPQLIKSWQLFSGTERGFFCLIVCLTGPP